MPSWRSTRWLRTFSGTHASNELLDGEIFYTLREAQIVIESRRRRHKAVRLHASIGYRAPAIGVPKMIDGGEADDKIVAVPVSNVDPTYGPPFRQWTIFPRSAAPLQAAVGGS